MPMEGLGQYAAKAAEQPELRFLLYIGKDDHSWMHPSTSGASYKKDNKRILPLDTHRVVGRECHAPNLSRSCQ